MAKGKQSRAKISSAPAKNRVAEFEHSQTVLEGLRKDLEAVRRRLRVSDDLVRALCERLLGRHAELRRLRAVPDELRGPV